MKSVLKLLTKTRLKGVIYHALHLMSALVVFISFHFNADYPKDQTLKAAVGETMHTRQQLLGL